MMTTPRNTESAGESGEYIIIDEEDYYFEEWFKKLGEET